LAVTVTKLKPTPATVQKGSFTRMQDGTREDYLMLEDAERQHAENVVDRILAQLRALKDEPLPLQVDRLEHSLQSATRAHRDGGR